MSPERIAHEMQPRGKTLIRARSSPRRPLHRWLPLLIVIGAIALAWIFGLHDYLSFAMVADNRQALRAFVSENFSLSIAAYALLYFMVTALLIPGAALLTVLGGFLFGWPLAAPLTIVSATLGATVIFLAARSSFGDLLVKKGGPLARKLASSIAGEAFGYLLFLRLVPVFPFFAVNIAAALCNLKTRTFFLATLIGIVPATFAYAVLGSGLDAIIEAELIARRECLKAQPGADCGFDFHPLSLLTPEIVAGFVLLGAMALIPALLKTVKASRPNRTKHP